MELLGHLVTLWVNQIELCRKSKEKHFGKAARRAWGFLGKSYRELYLEKGEDSQDFSPGQGPYYKARLAKSAEYVATMIPAIHSRVPNRLVTPRRPELPPELLQLQTELLEEGAEQSPTEVFDRIGSALQQWWLNYLVTECGLAREARTILPEALVKGRGVAWTEMTEGPYGDIPATFGDSVDHLFIDADAKQLRDAGFIVRQHWESAWKFAERFPVPIENLRSNASTNWQEAMKATYDLHQSNQDDQGDIIIWYEIYSRMGIGHKLPQASDQLKALADALEELGPNVYLAIVPGLPYPANLRPEMFGDEGSAEEIKASLEWSIPFYEQVDNPWPCSCLDFMPNSDNPWATSNLEAGLPLQIFLDNAYSWIMSRVRTTCRDIILAAAELEEALKEAIESGADQEIVQVSAQTLDDIAKFVYILQFPEVNKDLWQIIAMAERAFERITGVSPLLSGAEPEKMMRSSFEAQSRESHATSRPDDFADTVEAWHSSISRAEAFVSRLYIGPEIIAPLVGEAYDPAKPQAMGPITQAWMDHVHTDDQAVAAAEFAYQVEAGSGRRKNRQKQQGDAQMLVETLREPYMSLAMSGFPYWWNELLRILGQAFEIPVQKLMLPEGMQVGAKPEPEKKPEKKA